MHFEILSIIVDFNDLVGSQSSRCSYVVRGWLEDDVFDKSSNVTQEDISNYCTS